MALPSRSATSRAETTTSPSCVNLTALPTRLVSTCRRRVGSPRTCVGHRGRDVGDQLDLVLARPGPQQAGRGLDQPRQVERDDLEPQAVGLDLGEVEDVVQQREQRLARRLDQVERAPLLAG